VDGRALAQILRIKKGHPRIESFIGPGIFVSPDRPFLTFYKEGGLFAMKQWVVGWIAAVLVMGALPAWGKDVRRPEEAVKVMEKIVVTAGRLEEKKEDVTTNITVLTEEEIKKSSVHDLGDLLGEQGFLIMEYPNSLVSVDIRGFKTETRGNDLTGHVLLLINGRRTGTGNLAKIPLDNVERVEIIRGPGSVQYGSSAIGGIVNVITKQGHGKPSVYAEGTLGSWNYQKSSAGASGQFKNFDFSLTGSTESKDDYSTAHGDTYYNTGFDSKERVSINAGWTFMPKNRIGIIYTGYEGEGIGSPSFLSQNDLDDYVDHSIKTFDAVYDGQTTDGFLLWNLRYFQGKDEYETFDPENYGDMHSYFRDTDQQGAQAQFTVKWNHTHVTTGFDWTYYEVQDIYTTGDEYTYDNPAVFFLAKTKLLDDKLVLSVGGRNDWYDVESDDGQSTDESNWSTSVGAAYKFTSGVSIRVNYAEGFRMPTAEELFMYNDYSAWGFGIWSGNADLDPEKSQTYEIGIDISKKSFFAGLTYFYTDFKDKISYAYDPADGVTRYKNIDGATISGIEGSLKFDIGDFFDWTYKLEPYASFTCFLETEDEQNDTDLFYIGNWTASYGVKFSNPKIGFVSRLNLAYVSEQDVTNYEGTGDTTLSSYTVADLSISKEIFSYDRFGRVLLNTDISNLFNKDYALIQGYPSPGRTFYIGLKYVY
jgi:vitamin B12 transporter